MIRKMQQTELEAVSKIWLEGNLEAHNFINPSYWINHLPAVEEQFKEADIFVFVDEQVEGFAGMSGNYLAGIFVAKSSRDHGIGKQLVNFLKTRYDELTLDVYDKNIRAKEFYEHNDFQIDFETTDPDNDEKEYRMIWSK